jgi:hypothetical protein
MRRQQGDDEEGFSSVDILKISTVSDFKDPALLDLEVAIAKNVIYFPRNE